MCRKREGRVKKTSVTILYIDFSLFFKVVFRDSEFLKEKRRSKKGEQKFRKREAKEEEEDETLPYNRFVLIHFLRRASFCRLHQKLSETVPREE